MSWGTSLLAILVGVLGVMNTMLMTVFERTYEISVLLAIGWTRARIVRMILYESALLGLFAIQHSVMARPAFKAVWEAGDVTGLVDQLDSNARATIDGGGKVSAALAPLTGAEQIARFFLDIYRRQPDLAISESTINGQPGLIAEDANGQTLAAVSFGLRNQRISDIWVMRNPDKLVTWIREA